MLQLEKNIDNIGKILIFYERYLRAKKSEPFIEEYQEEYQDEYQQETSETALSRRIQS